MIPLHLCILGMPDPTQYPPGAAAVPSMPFQPTAVPDIAAHPATAHAAAAAATAAHPVDPASDRSDSPPPIEEDADGLYPYIPNNAMPAQPPAAVRPTTYIDAALQGQITSALQSSAQTRPNHTPVTPAATQPFPTNLALAGRIHETALVARRDSLYNHGILGVCPFVTPVLLMDGQESGQYLHIQEKGTGRPANNWTIAVFDSGADCTICSQRFARANNLTVGPDAISINTANGASTTTLGELCRPLEFWLVKDTPNACCAVAPVQVMAGADDLYDIILSMEIIMQWCAHINTADGTMVFQPDWWTKNCLKRSCALPVRITPRVVIDP
jgi:hypothetical protein